MLDMKRGGVGKRRGGDYSMGEKTGSRTGNRDRNPALPPPTR